MTARSASAADLAAAEGSGVFVHERALVETDDVGAGTRIWAFSHVMPGARIGVDCNICDHTFVEADVIIGDRVTIKSGVYVWDGLRLEDEVFVGPQATFANDPFPRSKRPFEYPTTTVRRGASIGAAAVILPGITVGEARGLSRRDRHQGRPRVRGRGRQPGPRRAHTRPRRVAQRAGDLVQFRNRTALKTRAVPWCEAPPQE